MRLGQKLGARLAEAHRAAAAATLHLPDEEEPHADDDDERQPAGQQDCPERALLRRAGRDLHAAGLEPADDIGALWDDRLETRAVPHVAVDHVVGDGHCGDRPGVNIAHKLAVALVRHRNRMGGRLKDLKQAHQHEQDHQPDGEVAKICVHWIVPAGLRRRPRARDANLGPALGRYKGGTCRPSGARTNSFV